MYFKQLGFLNISRYASADPGALGRQDKDSPALGVFARRASARLSVSDGGRVLRITDRKGERLIHLAAFSGVLQAVDTPRPRWSLKSKRPASGPVDQAA